MLTLSRLMPIGCVLPFDFGRLAVLVVLVAIAALSPRMA